MTYVMSYKKILNNDARVGYPENTNSLSLTTWPVVLVSKSGALEDSSMKGIILEMVL